MREKNLNTQKCHFINLLLYFFNRVLYKCGNPITCTTLFSGINVSGSSKAGTLYGKLDDPLLSKEILIQLYCMLYPSIKGPFRHFTFTILLTYYMYY